MREIGVTERFSHLRPVVAFARSEQPGYGLLSAPETAPELPAGQVATVGAKAIRDLFIAWGLDCERIGTAFWNPLGEFVSPGSKVLLKPNWVLHWNQSGQGLDCLITHASVIESVLEYIVLARPGRIVLGDAPIQGCNFDELTSACAIDGIVERFRSRDVDISLHDFRRTVLLGRSLGHEKIENRQALADYILVDLQSESLVEPLCAAPADFRVTMYNPDLLARTHAPGRHQYLIAREILDCDVFFNLPKLKTHKKAGVTGALKNLVGINGNKEFLPHHRKGCPEAGGDCYREWSWFKARAEDLLDAANRLTPGRRQALLARLSEIALRLATLAGTDENLEGAWYGNDTVWRMSLDLQRILRYATADGKCHTRPVRQIVSITDAIIAGQGEGPLAPDPVASGFVTGALNPAAAEWVHALLMGFDPRRIPIISEAFSIFSYAVAEFDPNCIRVRSAAGEHTPEKIAGLYGLRFKPPRGWAGHCEWKEQIDPEARERSLVE